MVFELCCYGETPLWGEGSAISERLSIEYVATVVVLWSSQGSLFEV